MCGGDKPYLAAEPLEREHTRARQAALELFHGTRKMGGPEFSEAFERSLLDECDAQFEQLKMHNDSKNIFAAARSPAVLFSVMMACYILSGLLGMLGLETLASVFNLFMGLALLMLSGWSYVRYSGEHRELGMRIDQLTDILWEMVSLCYSYPLCS